MNKYAFGFYINNYPGTQSDLNGCVNDGKDMMKKLQKKGFSCKFLFDGQATTTNVLNGIQDLLSISKAGDSLFFGNSSHGTYDYRPGTTEADKTDEGFCTISDRGDRIDVIWDDTIWAMFKSKKPGVQCVWFADSCFGGGAMRLIGRQAKGIPRSIPFRTVMQANPQAAVHPKREISFTEDKSPWPFLWLAGSQETEPCYDANYGGRPNGAFTYTALTALDSTPPGLNYLGWYNAICKKLPTQDYPQHPMMAGSYQNAKIFS
jgi:metacaspase-1